MLADATLCDYIFHYTEHIQIMEIKTGDLTVQTCRLNSGMSWIQQ